MYSRYIPPKKTSRAEQLKVSEVPTSPAQRTTKPPSTKHDASSTYTRYVPSKSSAHSPPMVILEEPTVDSQPKKKKRKIETAPAPAPAPEELSEPAQSPITVSKAKKHKKPHASTSSGSSEPSPEDDSKHKRLMEKREKSLKKAGKLAKKAAKKAEDAAAEEDDHSTIQEAKELHDLVPLPQPEPVPEAPAQSLNSSLPPWLSAPIRVSPTATASFSSLGVSLDVQDALKTKGFNEAFAVQAAALPLLLPGPPYFQGDVLVSAATGSGKTLAYVLPMTEDISKSIVTKLRGVIVMPTRELVAQAREVCELCATVFSVVGRKRVKIGTAVGNETFKAEQAALIEDELHFDPGTYEEQLRRLNAKWESSDIDSDVEDEALYNDEQLSTLPFHITSPVSKVDILVCTPGRLVEHIKSTPGFTLDDVKWMVVDEADKLLDQSFQQWIETVIGRLEEPQSTIRRDPVRKIILSATMTRDLGQLNSLKLHRPKLVVLEVSSDENIDSKENALAHVLPSSLVEAAVKTDDESLKPLYLIELIRREGLYPELVLGSDTSSGSDSSSEDSSSSEDESDDSSATPEVYSRAHDIPSNSVSKKPETPHGILVFTKSNETAVRLGRLLGLIDSSYSTVIGTLTSTTSTSSRRKTIQSFTTGKLSILVASDLVSRGLDLPDLAHVINYDVPSSITNYVHRVGRTARAGKKGWAWTMFTPTEGRWFWQEIARSSNITRPVDAKVSRVNIEVKSFDDGLRTRYEAALEALSREARSSKLQNPKRD